MSMFMEVLEWCDGGAEEMVRRLPQEGSADIKMGAQLIVQQSQTALFFRDGKCLDALGPGRHVLSTLNLPILTRLLALPYGCQSPFRAAVYFVNRKTFSDLKWGTKNPVVFRDRELGVVRLRGYGRFNLNVSDPVLFVNKLVGAQPNFGVGQIEDYLRDVIVARLNDLLGEQKIGLYDLPALYNEIAAAAKVQLREDFRRYGLELIEFYVNSITPPEGVQKMIDERSGLEAVGDLNRFLKFEAARALANGGNGGSGAGAMETGVGAGLGLALAPSLLRGVIGPNEAATPTGPTDPATAAVDCPHCRTQISAEARYCPMCGEARSTTRTCAKCRASLPDQARFCPQCGEPDAK